MELFQIEWKSVKQKEIIVDLLKELHIKFREISIDNQELDNLYGEGFKKSILKAKKAYEKGETDQFIKMKKDDLWK